MFSLRCVHLMQTRDCINDFPQFVFEVSEGNFKILIYQTILPFWSSSSLCQQLHNQLCAC